MSKITEEGYFLPVIEALTPYDLFESGANKPLLITGIDENGQKGDYVVKLMGAERMSVEASMRELLAAFIATQIDIRVVDPVIVHISERFIELLTGSDAWQLASKSMGINYGSRYIEHYSTMLPGLSLSNHQLTHAQRIFAFDIAIQNPDRTAEKPNMFTDGTEIVIYDHELAFSFLFDLLGTSRPWELRDADLSWIRKLYLLPHIKGQKFDFEGFCLRFDNLDENFWMTARSLIPKEWLTDQFDCIKHHFSGIIHHKDEFVMELKKLMA